MTVPAQPYALAAYATKPEESRGRLHPEPESPVRTAFQRDRDRVIHAASFRRLKHKTQVFVAHEGDHFRTRLTHSIEVAQIARTICRVLGLNEDIVEALALAHDLGHTPFGHAGEDALNEVMAPYGGFDHNAQTLRLVTRLEHKYADFDGLNLTWETLEGVVKHNGPLIGPNAANEKPVPEPILDYVREHDLEIGTFAGPEAQVAALSDDIAYNNHDIDDGLRAGLFALEDLADLPLVGPVIAEVRRRYAHIEQPRLIHETVRRLIDAMVTDLLEETRRRLAAAKPRSAAAIRALDRPVAAFSDEKVEQVGAVRTFLRRHMYRHHMVTRMARKSQQVVRELFERLFAAPDLMPGEWQARARDQARPRVARVVADYIAGMTDRFALDEHHRFLDPHAAT